ncbi:MAG: adenylate/guanylate cyclase domain-containing protein [Steroidobacteraceae bacterium]
MIDYALLESAVANWLWSAAKDLLVRQRSDKWPDFELRSGGGERILLELKAKPPSPSAFEHLAQRFRAASDPAARFLLVTPDEPEQHQVERFADAFQNVPGKAEWIALKDLPTVLGKPSPGSWTSPKTWSDLQTEALIKGLEAYAAAPVGPAPYAAKTPSNEVEALARQFPFEVVARIQESQESLESQLGLGARRENVTIVLSDIVNFSSLVTASRPDDLKEAMGQYYQQARQAVFDHGGMLDKFIGDAILAVFGYPHFKSHAPCDAIRFARALTLIGRSVMSSWQAELNAVIDTGTRVGIATGDIWPINIGRSSIEVTLLGDTINLAARLEKNCVVDKMLIDNRTRTAAHRADDTFVTNLNLQQVIIPPADAKGQAFPIRAWALP